MSIQLPASDISMNAVAYAVTTFAERMQTPVEASSLEMQVSQSGYPDAILVNAKWFNHGIRVVCDPSLHDEVRLIHPECSEIVRWRLP